MGKSKILEHHFLKHFDVIKAVTSILSLYVSGRTVSSGGFLRDRLYLVCSAAFATATWRISCLKIFQDTKGTLDLAVFQSAPACIHITHHGQKRALFLCCSSPVILLSLCPAGVWWDWWMTSFWLHQTNMKHKLFSSITFSSVLNILCYCTIYFGVGDWNGICSFLYNPK